MPKLFERVSREAQTVNYVVGERDEKRGLHWTCSMCGACVSLNSTAQRLVGSGASIVCRECFKAMEK